MKRALAFLLFAVFASQPALALHVNVAPNTEAPSFALKDLDGRTVSSASLRGKVVLLNFWATWCKPCKDEMPLFDELYRKYRQKGFEVVAVSINNSKKSVTDFLEKRPVSFTVLMDSDSRVFKLYRVYSIPTTFLIDRSGLIVAKYHGSPDWTSKEITSLIEDLLK
ncbi:MAG: hypothetical protein Kow0025_10690 [Thermodesulfovibrionales bacterium]